MVVPAASGRRDPHVPGLSTCPQADLRPGGCRAPEALAVPPQAAPSVVLAVVAEVPPPPATSRHALCFHRDAARPVNPKLLLLSCS